jgi:hypothetical protein
MISGRVSIRSIRRRGFLANLLAVVVAVAVAAACSTAPLPHTPTPAPSASGGGGCPVAEQTGVLRSNTLIDMAVSSDGVSDSVTFQLGELAPGPTGSAGRLKAVDPPFTEGASGLPVEVMGTHFVELHFDGMLIVDEAGTVLYTGETSVKPGLPALRQVEMTEAFEGVYNFVIGYDGGGCVTLTENATANTITVSIGH